MLLYTMSVIMSFFAVNSKEIIVEYIDTEVRDKEITTLDAGLSSDKLANRLQTANLMRKTRNKNIQLLKSLAEKEGPKSIPTDPSNTYPFHSSKHLAMLLLGDIRASEAVQVLLDNIEYRTPKDPFDAKLFGDISFWYPSADSLAKIGMPVIDPVIEKLGTYDKECQGRKNCVWIIKKVLGIKLGGYKLQLAIEETKDEKVKKNLQAVLPTLKTLQEQLDAERARGEKEKQKQK